MVGLTATSHNVEDSTAAGEEQDSPRLEGTDGKGGWKYYKSTKLTKTTQKKGSKSKRPKERNETWRSLKMATQLGSIGPFEA